MTTRASGSRLSTVPDLGRSGRMTIGGGVQRVVGTQNTNQITKKNAPTNSRKSVMPSRTNTTMLGTGTRVTDPRNFSDKQFLNDSIRSLLKFLTEHNYDYSINPKILSRPSNKDFSNIVLFLFKQYDSNYTLTGKFEDEVVAMFKQIGYPCTISKANITAAGTPHAWPSLLAALVWLVELLQYDESFSLSTSLQNPTSLHHPTTDLTLYTDHPNTIQTTFYTYLSQAYTYFMLGEDSRYEALEAKYINTYNDKNLLIQDDILITEQHNNMLINEIENIELRRNTIPELESRKKEYNIELNKYQYLIEQLEKQRLTLHNKVYIRTNEYDKLISNITILNEEISVLQYKISNQELSPEDVKRMNLQREQLEQAQQQVGVIIRFCFAYEYVICCCIYIIYLCMYRVHIYSCIVSYSIHILYTHYTVYVYEYLCLYMSMSMYMTHSYILTHICTLIHIHRPMTTRSACRTRSASSRMS